MPIYHFTYKADALFQASIEAETKEEALRKINEEDGEDAYDEELLDIDNVEFIGLLDE